MTKEEFKKAREISKKIEDLESKIKDLRFENERASQGVRSVCVNLESGGYLYVNDLNNFTKTYIEINTNKINTYNEEIKELRKEFSEL